MNTPPSPDLIEFMQWSQSRSTRALREKLNVELARHRRITEAAAFDQSVPTEELRAHAAASFTLTSVLNWIDNLPSSSQEAEVE